MKNIIKRICQGTEVWLFDLLTHGSNNRIKSLLACSDLNALMDITEECAGVAFDAQENTINATRSLGIPVRIAIQKLPATNGLKRLRIFAAHTIADIRNNWLMNLPSDVSCNDAGKFYPQYTFMLPAFYLVKVNLLRPMDFTYDWLLPTPEHKRVPRENWLASQIGVIGKTYLETAHFEIENVVDVIPKNVPIGIAFSGGIDSAAITLLLVSVLEKLKRNNSVHLFTLALTPDSPDAKNAKNFLNCVLHGKQIEHYLLKANLTEVNGLTKEVCLLVEDYQVRDLECAIANFLLFKTIRDNFPDIHYIFTGEGGNEAFSEYPLIDRGYRRIDFQDVIENPLLFYLGYPMGQILCSKTKSSGLSRGIVRTFNPAVYFGFSVYAPFISKRIVSLVQRFPLPDLACDSEKFLKLRGRCIKEGIKSLLGIDIPVASKVRFQDGVSSKDVIQVTWEERENLRAYLNRELMWTPKFGKCDKP